MQTYVGVYTPRGGTKHVIIRAASLFDAAKQLDYIRPEWNLKIRTLEEWVSMYGLGSTFIYS